MKSSRIIFGIPSQFSLGVDVSKKELCCCISMCDAEKKVKVCSTRDFDNTPSGIEQLAAWVKKNNKLPNQPMDVCIEPTSTYHEKLLYSSIFQTCNVRFFVVQPNRAKAYAASIGQNSKNDRADAKVLAQFVLMQGSLLQEYEALPTEVRKVRDLLRHRTSIVEQKTAMKNQKDAYISGGVVEKDVVAFFDETINFQEKTALKIEKEVEKLVNKLPDFALNCQRLMTIKGIALLTAACILSEYNQFKNFQNIAQVVSWAGLDIIQNQSGSKQGTSKISKKGNKYVRRQLYCPVATHIRNKEGCFSANHQRVLEKNKGKYFKAAVSTMRKLLILCFSMTKHRTDYCPKKHEERITNYRLQLQLAAG